VFATDIPLAIRLLLEFLVVLGVIGGAAWAMRQLNSGGLPGANPHNQLARLSVADAIGIGLGRRLVLLRRDNVEHLVLIHGPIALVVEPNIVHAAATPHDLPAHLPSPTAPLPRALLRRDEGSKPLPKPEATPRPELPPEEPAAWRSDAARSTRLQRRSLAALADELSTRSPAPRANPSVTARPIPSEPRREFEPESQLEVPPEPGIASRPEPQIAPPQPVVAPPTPTAHQSLAEMARRLRAALDQAKIVPAPERAPAPAAAPPSPLRAPAPPKPLRADVGPSQPDRLTESLEQEMARLLGRITKN
jgi:flagellar protein FliO/FliZ